MKKFDDLSDVEEGLRDLFEDGRKTAANFVGRWLVMVVTGFGTLIFLLAGLVASNTVCLWVSAACGVIFFIVLISTAIKIYGFVKGPL